MGYNGADVYPDLVTGQTIHEAVYVLMQSETKWWWLFFCFVFQRARGDHTSVGFGLREMQRKKISFSQFFSPHGG